MSKNRFNIAEFESMSFDKVKTLFLAIKDGADKIESARIEAVKAKDDYNKHHECNANIQKIDSAMFEANLRLYNLAHVDFVSKFKSLYAEFTEKYASPTREKSQELWNISNQKQEAIKIVSLEVYGKIQIIAKSLGFPFYRRINEKMDCYEFNQLFRLALQHLFVIIHSNDGLKYDMRDSCMYIGPDNKYYPLHQERDIMEVYNLFVKERE